MENENINTTPEETVEETKTYTQEEVDALIQSRSDQRVTQATEKMNRKIKALEKQVENAKTLSQLDEEQRAVAEKDMLIAELKERVEGFEYSQNMNEVVKTFSARGLPVELAEHINIGKDLDTALKVVDAIDKIWKKEVAREVKARLAETSPGAPQIADAMSGKMTKEQFNKLSIAEQQAMYNSDPELVKNLLG